jgi:hypothetical protein
MRDEEGACRPWKQRKHSLSHSSRLCIFGRAAECPPPSSPSAHPSSTTQHPTLPTTVDKEVSATGWAAPHPECRLEPGNAMVAHRRSWYFQRTSWF